MACLFSRKFHEQHSKVFIELNLSHELTIIVNVRIKIIFQWHNFILIFLGSKAFLF